MSRTAEATLTDFLRDPKSVVERVEHVDVVLHRRNAEDLRLSLESRAEAVEDGVWLMSRVMSTALNDPTVRERLSAALDAIPWLSFLPMEQRHEFVVEFFRTAAGAAELGVMTPLTQLLREWQATAAIYADPELATELKRPLAGDSERVLAPHAG
jgi:hypothetical protein